MSVLRSRDNPRVRHWSKLARDSRYRRSGRRALIEGPHLLAALLDARLQPLAILATEAALAGDEIRRLVERAGLEPVLLPAGLFRAIVETENPPGIAAEIALPEAKQGDSPQAVFLEGVQDPGNVGAILRSAAALGVAVVVLDSGCADPWSPKVLRSAAGAHFRLPIQQVQGIHDVLSGFKGKIVCTVPRGGLALREADLSGRLAWVFGSEGGGVSPALQEQCDFNVTIPTAPGTESLNVAAAAAICLYEAFSRPGGGS